MVGSNDHTRPEYRVVVLGRGQLQQNRPIHLVVVEEESDDEEWSQQSQQKTKWWW